MAITDPIADALTIIRNGVRAKKERVDLRASKLMTEVLKVLKRERFIFDYRLIEDKKQGILRVYLRKAEVLSQAPAMAPSNRLISRIDRISKPGRRVYADKQNIPIVLNGLGVCVVSTPHGLMTGEEAKKRGVGGEVLLRIW